MSKLGGPLPKVEKKPDTTSRKYYYGLLSKTFEDRYGFSPKTNSITISWKIYTDANFEQRMDAKTRKYYTYDKKTGQRVTSEYKAQLRKEMGGGLKYLQNLGAPLSKSEIRAQLNIFDKQNEFNIAQERNKFDKVIGDTYYTDDATGEVKGKIKTNKNAIQAKAAEELLIARSQKDSIPINFYNQGLLAMGIQPRTWSEPGDLTSVPNSVSTTEEIVNKNNKLTKKKKLVPENQIVPVVDGINNGQWPANQFPNQITGARAPASFQQQNILNKPEVKSATKNQKLISNYGKLMLNPGGIVGRDADVRTSTGGSTSLSIAQADFAGAKAGEPLGVLTRSQRNRYDRDVLKIGG